MERNRPAVALFSFHEAQKSRDYLWRASLSGSGSVQCDHRLQVKGLRKEVRKRDGGNGIARCEERLQIARQSGGVARNVDEIGGGNFG